MSLKPTPPAIHHQRQTFNASQPSPVGIDNATALQSGYSGGVVVHAALTTGKVTVNLRHSLNFIRHFGYFRAITRHYIFTAIDIAISISLPCHYAILRHATLADLLH